MRKLTGKVFRFLGSAEFGKTFKGEQPVCYTAANVFLHGHTVCMYHPTTTKSP